VTELLAAPLGLAAGTGRVDGDEGTEFVVDLGDAGERSLDQIDGVKRTRPDASRGVDRGRCVRDGERPQLSASFRLTILPVSLRGSASRKCTSRGTL
jgi:hypothetical protein